MENVTLNFVDLEKIDLFSALNSDAKREVAAKCYGVKAMSGEEIIGYLDRDDSVFFVVDGKVRVNMISAGGRQITYQILDTGEMFGELSAIDGLPRSASVVAETDVVLAKMSAADFLKLASSDASLVLMAMKRLTSLSRWLAARVFEYHAYNVKGRVYLELLRLTEKEPSKESLIKISDRDMASRVGTTRENVTRICGDLKQNGLIQRNHEGITVLDRARLEGMLDECEFS